MLMKKVVSASWLSQHLETVRVLDASWSLPPFAYADGTTTQEAFLKGPRIPTAQFWDLDMHSDESAAPGVPHNLPTKAQFQQAAIACNLKPESRVVVYDQFGIFSSPRLYWTLKRFGLQQVAVLDGGLPAWLDEEYQVCQGTPEKQTSGSNGSEAFSTDERYEQWRLQDIRNWLSADPETRPRLLDARSRPRFDGSVPDPRGLRSGHVPGSRSVPFTDLLRQKDGLKDDSLPGGMWRGATFKSEDELRDLLLPPRTDDERTTVVKKGENKIGLSCGSGMTAAVLALGLDIIDAADTIALYDGSWTEYAQTSEMPVHTSQE